MTQENSIEIRLHLTGEAAEKFLYIKKRRGLQANTEVIRALIQEEYMRVAGHP